MPDNPSVILRVHLYALTSLTTFAVGLSIVWLSLGEQMPNTTDIDVYAQRSQVTFSLTGHGCGNGYAAGYDTDDGRTVSEGLLVFDSRRETRAAIEEEVDGNLVIEHIPKHTGYKGTGERYVVELQRPGTKGVNILFYEGDDKYGYIYASDLPLALKFEQYLADEAVRLTAEAEERSKRTLNPQLNQ